MILTAFHLTSLQNLVKHLPEQEQLNALAKFENEYANLSEPEQFGVVVSIHWYAARWPDGRVSALRLGACAFNSWWALTKYQKKMVTYCFLESHSASIVWLLGVRSPSGSRARHRLHSMAPPVAWFNATHFCNRLHQTHTKTQPALFSASSLFFPYDHVYAHRK